MLKSQRTLALVTLASVAIGICWWVACLVDAGPRSVHARAPSAPVEEADRAAVDELRVSPPSEASRTNLEVVDHVMVAGLEPEPDESARSIPRSVRYVVVGPYRIPIPGAVVSFCLESSDGSLGEKLAEAVSGSDGTFEVTLPTAVWISARASAVGFATEEWRSRWLNSDPEEVEFVDLAPALSQLIQGDLVTPQGEPLPVHVLALLRGEGSSRTGFIDPRASSSPERAQVVFVPRGVGVPERATGSVRDVRPATLVAELGHFAFEPQPFGVVGTLRAEWCGLRLGSAEWTGRDDSVEIVVDPDAFLGSLCGFDLVVSTPTRDSGSDWAMVNVWNFDGSFHCSRNVERGRARRLCFELLRPGPYFVDVEADDAYVRAGVHLRSGGHQVVELDAVAGGRILIDVLRWPAQAAARPIVFPIDGLGSSCEVSPRRGGADGAFEIRVPSGRHVVALNGEARIVDVLSQDVVNVQLAWSESVPVVFEIASESGDEWVLDPWIMVWLEVENADGTKVVRDCRSFAIDADGSARIVIPLVPGDFVVRADLFDVAIERRFTVSPGESRTTVRLR